jgi:hypothetical protein
MTNTKLLAFCFFTIVFLAGCNTEGENTYAGYTTFQVKIDFQPIRMMFIELSLMIKR